MGKYDDAVAALIRGGVRNADDAASIVAKFGPDKVLKGIKASAGAIDGDLLTKITKFLKDPEKIARIASTSDNLYARALGSAIRNGKIESVIVDGKVVKGDFSFKDLSRFSGKSVDDIAKMADDVEVQNAAKMKKDDLIKLGISGSLVAGVIFLMLVTGKSNPVEAIAEALKAAAETAADAASDAGRFALDNIFKGMSGFFNVSALFLFCSSVGLVIWLVLSVVLKK